MIGPTFAHDKCYKTLVRVMGWEIMEWLQQTEPLISFTVNTPLDSQGSSLNSIALPWSNKCTRVFPWYSIKPIRLMVNLWIIASKFAHRKVRKPSAKAPSFDELSAAYALKTIWSWQFGEKITSTPNLAYSDRRGFDQLGLLDKPRWQTMLFLRNFEQIWVEVKMFCCRCPIVVVTCLFWFLLCPICHLCQLFTVVV